MNGGNSVSALLSEEREAREKLVKDVAERVVETFSKKIVAALWAIAGTLFVGIATGTYAYSDVLHRVSNIETWKNERTKPLEDFYRWQTDIESKMSEIRSEVKSNSELTKEMRNWLKEILERRQ